MSKSAPDKQSGTLDDTLHPDAAAPQPNASRSRTRRLKDSPLTESDWVEAATDILVRENVRGIRIDTLCQKLGVTKGSFYWHFKTRADLLAAMLKNWQRRMTLNVIQNISRTNETGFSRLRNLMALPRMPRSPAFAQVEMSIRDWGRRVDLPHQAVEEVDHIRLEYFAELFRAEGFSQAEAHSRAYLAYCLMMGDSILHKTLKPLSDEEFVEKAMQLLSSREDGMRP
ncbi:TetR family transcriptional regulator [Rhizobium sp. Root149]|uniref:TetR/AcrR family transcriptional regulator n=1 Tax=Rhizobium TaxID=379 RepID=UPI000712B7B0|nr:MULTISPECIES: TetR/AcrR family transcriptional regulator [Rhizobium]KQZ57910.1 TetR family transcriptional regulator [Rhizobium sp. Root149]